VSALYSAQGLGYAYGDREALHDLTIDLRSGELAAIVGPNGAGKSTLMGVLAGVRDGYSGACRLEGVEVSAWNKRLLARRAAFVPQSLRLEFPFTAEQVVFMGRTPYCDGLFETEEDRAAVRRAMEMTDSLPFAGRPFRALSGGEKQRVILASALAQEPDALLLDEPTTYLDLEHQLSLYRLLRDLARQGKTVVAVTHDLNLAAAYSDRVLVLAGGSLAADGPADAVVTERLVADVFHATVRVTTGECGRPSMSFG